MSRRSRSVVGGSRPTLARLRSHVAELVGEVVRYKDSYQLCYLRGPSGICEEEAKIGQRISQRADFPVKNCTHATLLIKHSVIETKVAVDN